MKSAVPAPAMPPFSPPPPASVPLAATAATASTAATAPATPACERCLELAADPRRREPPSCLALRNTAPVVSQSAAGVPFSMLSFTCRDCGTVWRLYDRANELFVSWVPERPLVR